MTIDPMEDYHQKRARTRLLIESVTFCMCGYYCTLKEYMCTAPRSSREIQQIKCVEKFKFERSKALDKHIDWKEGFELWVIEGHAAAFAHHFKEGVGFNEHYRLVMDTPRPPPPEADSTTPRWLTGLDAQLANGFPIHVTKPGPEDHRKWWKARRRLIEDIAGCPREHYCTLKEILCSGPKGGREISQIKCVEKFKYERGKWLDRHVDWQEAFEMWIGEGNAKRFAAFYHEDVHFEDLYRRIMGPEPLPGK